MTPSAVLTPDAFTTVQARVLALVDAATGLLEGATCVVDFPLPSAEELRQYDLGSIAMGELDHLVYHESEHAAERHLADQTAALLKA